MSDLVQGFQSPGSEYRGLAFWAWNARLSQDELIRQIHLFKKMGLGGFFMHSRVGLETPYLSKEWFECIRTCVTEAQKLGMQAWIYDEDRWPSGAAGGLVTKDDRYKEKKLAYEIIQPDEESNGEGETLAWYEVSWSEKNHLAAYQRITQRVSTRECLRFYWRYATKNSWFNGETYLNTMSEDAVRQFINVTHEAYKHEVGDDFSKTIPGFFTDEPCFTNFVGGQGCLGWTDGLEMVFRKKYGYDLCDHLPELFFAVQDECTRARWDYRNLLTELFVKAFPKIIGEWCEMNHVALTGHVLAEDTLFAQTLYVGSAMRFYEYMQIPGVDLLTEHWNTYATTKQCTSAARQFGKAQRLCECYGCTGWDFPLAGHKAIGDWLYALGINKRCMHLAWYSMEGEAKRDYPASISYQSPWYDKYGCVEDYFSRLGAILTGGDEKRDILLLHAVESYWCMAYQTAGDGSPAMVELDRQFTHVYNQLLSENLDFDFGDEEILSRLATVDNGTLHVGDAVYRTVVIPVLKTIRSSTLALLEQFVKSGGTVYAIGDAPALVDAVPSAKAEIAYCDFSHVSMTDFTAKIAEQYRIVSLATPEGKQAGPLLYRLAHKEDAWICFICNTSNPISDDFFNVPAILNRQESFSKIIVEIEIPKSGAVYEMNPSTGEIAPIAFCYQDGRYHFETSFAQLQSRLFMISCHHLATRKQPTTTISDVFELKLPAQAWNYRLSEDNVLVMDHAAFSINDSPLSAPEYILKIDQQLRARLGVQSRSGNMVQPWLVPEKDNEQSLNLHLDYCFACDSIPRTCRLALEHPEYYTIMLNGQKVHPLIDGWWVDVVIKTISLPTSLLQQGENHLVIESAYQASQPGLEAIFLLGDFGVYNDAIGKLPAQLHAGDVCAQGLPYYAGNITYRTHLDALAHPYKHIMLTLPAWRGTALGVRVNHGEEQILAWPPFCLDVAPWLKADGKDEIEITVYGHRRNAFGPFYDTEVSPTWCGSGTFYAQDVVNRNLVPLGILD